MPAVRKKAVAPPSVPLPTPPEPDVLRWTRAVIEVVGGDLTGLQQSDLLAVGVRMGKHDRDLTLDILKHLRKGN